MIDLSTKKTRPSFEIAEEVARRSRRDWRTYTKIIDAAMTIKQRYDAPFCTLAEHYKRLGWAGDGAEHLVALERDGWVQITQDGKWYWVVSCSVPLWMTPSFMSPRCEACVAADSYRCDHLPINDRSASIKLYVLALDGWRNFYVGVSHRPLERFERHATGEFGSIWTRQHKPMRMVSCRVTTRVGHHEVENAKTLEMMRRYGVEHVQGGKYLGVAGQRLAARELRGEGLTSPGAPINLTFRDLARSAVGKVAA